MDSVKDVLAAEGARVSRMLRQSQHRSWSVETPAEGWTVRHQVAHLTSVFRLATFAVEDQAGFSEFMQLLSDDFSSNVAAAMEPLLGLGEEDLADAWDDAVARCVTAFDAISGETVVPWLVSPIPVRVLAMAGITEAFAHGQDIRDAWDVAAEHGQEIRYVCEFAYHTRTFGPENEGRPGVGDRLRFELTGPRGEMWLIGDETTENVVRGPALDHALLVTRRRHRDDLGLNATTAEADAWMDVAQAYRGPAGSGRKQGQFV